MIQNDHMQRSERHKLIISAVGKSSRTVDELAALTGASAVTIRRDLTDLAERDALRRVRGGAAPAKSRGATYPFGLRSTERPATKQALARAVASMINPGDSVLIDNGTTALAVAHELTGLGITALALSLHAAAALAAKPGNQVIVPGGPVNHDDLSFTAPGTADVIRRMRFDIAIIGSCAAHPDAGLTVADWGDAHVKRAALKSASRVCLATTADKFTQTAAHQFATYADLDTLVTTTDASPSALAEARLAGVEVLTVEPPPDQ